MTTQEKKTKYKVVDRQEEYDACKRLLLREGFPEQDFMFPTILAHQGGKLVGFLATSQDPDIILGGPLVLCTKEHRPWTALRLMSLYEQALQNIGIDSYTFWIDRNESKFMRKGIESHFPELKPYATEGSKDFYIRTISDGREDLSAAGVSGRESSSAGTGGIADSATHDHRATAAATEDPSAISG